MTAITDEQMAEYRAQIDARNEAERQRLITENAFLRGLVLSLTAPPTDHNHTRTVTPEQVAAAVDDCGGNKRAASALLGIPLPAVYRRLALTTDHGPRTKSHV
jgi:transcriptional regulator of acetoin/glycerol metabolism